MRGAGCGRGASHYAAIFNAGIRPGDVSARVRCAERTAARRSGVDPVGHLRAAKRSFIKVHRAAIDRLAIHEAATRSRGDGVHVVSVCIIKVAIAVAVHEIPVAHKCVAGVDAMPIARATVIPRTEWLTPAQREPAEASTKPKTAAQETNKRGSIKRSRIYGTRAPTPVATKIIPAAIVKRREAPGSVVDPSPTPRTYVAPVAIAVGRPILRDIVGSPNGTVLRIFLPSAVIVEITVANDISRNVARGSGIVFLQIAFLRPTVESIRLRRGTCSVVNVSVGAGDIGSFACVQGVVLTGGGNFAFATNHGDAGEIPVFVDVDTECSGLRDGERKIWRVHFIDVALTNFTNAEINFSFRKPHLNYVVVEVEKGERGHVAEVNGDLAHLKFRAGVCVAPKFVADGDRPILGSSAPIAGAARLDRNRTVENADTSNATRRIVAVVGCHGSVIHGVLCGVDGALGGRRRIAGAIHLRDVFLSLSFYNGRRNQQQSCSQQQPFGAKLD